MKNFRLLQLNIERDKHLDRILPFFEREQFDAICLQEVFEADARRLSERYGFNCHFAPRVLRDGAAEGVAILSPHPLSNERVLHYAGADTLMEGILKGTPEEKHATQIYVCAFADITAEGATIRIGTTHFPWTPDGSASDFQRESMQGLLHILKGEKNFVLTGDFNAPRKNLDDTSGEIFSRLAAAYTDNIPTHYTTSIDGDLHRAGALELMVDGIFSTPGFAISNVERICGLSDHCAFTALIEK